MKKIWYFIAAALAAVLAFVGFKSLFKKGNKLTTKAPTPKEIEAVEKQTEALIEKAKIEAVSEAKKAEIDKIMKIEDPKERLKRLADELKDL